MSLAGLTRGSRLTCTCVRAWYLRIASLKNKQVETAKRSASLGNRVSARPARQPRHHVDDATSDTNARWTISAHGGTDR